MRVFKDLIERQLQPFADDRPRPGTTQLALTAAAFQQANHVQGHAHAAAAAARHAKAAWHVAQCTNNAAEQEYAARIAQEACDTAATAAASAKRAAKLAAAGLGSHTQRGIATLSSHDDDAQKAFLAARRSRDDAREQLGQLAHAAGVGTLWLRKARAQLLDAARAGSSKLRECDSLLTAGRWLQGLRNKLLPRRRLHLPASLQSSLRIVVFVDDLDRCKPSKVCTRLPTPLCTG